MTVAAPGAVAAAAAVLGPRARVGMALGPLTTYRVGGPAAIGVVARHLEDLAAVAAAASASGLEVLVVGRGSNMLVADDGFPGIALVLDVDGFGSLDVDGHLARAGAALPLPALARRSVEAGLTGLEWAVGVPGSVGGGVRMNAGGHGSETAQTLRRAWIVDLSVDRVEEVVVGPADLGHGYRRSSLRPCQVVTAAEFALEDGSRQAGRATMTEIVRWRREHQPGGQNAGSVFVNPADPRDPSPGPAAVSAGPAVVSAGPAAPVPGDVSPDGGDERRSAGWLIEAGGLKGFRIGSAEVSTKHANFIQADPGGSADDVYAVLTTVAARVRERWGVSLRTELRLIGFHDHRMSISTGELS